MSQQLLATNRGKIACAETSLGYGKHLVVHEANLALEPATVSALVGPNGSGKSTLLRAFSRLHPLERGHISLDGQTDVRLLGAKDFATRVTLLSQSRPTPAGLTVADVVEFGRYPHRRTWRGTDPGARAAIARALELTGLTDLAHTNVDSLSGGQIQRAWFACALAQDTDILLLDEPTNHLDLRYQIETLELMRTLADEHGVTVGVVLHDLNQAAAVADRVVVLDQGRIVADGPPAQALQGPLLTQVYGIEIATTATERTVQITTPRIHSLLR